MALSTSRTVVTETGLSTGTTYNVGGILAGTSNLHRAGIEIAGINVLGGDTPIGSGSTIYDDGGARFSGVITATSFVGDISNATGAAAGLGTALSQTQTDPHNKVYYTNKVLSISTTTTIDHPATANLAYTQYSDIKIEDGHDLIIKDGDDFKYDILGISTTKIPSNQFPSGLSGDLTGNVTGNSDTATTLKNNSSVSTSGIITATSFSGSGANLTGIVHGIKEVDQWHLPSDWSTSGAYINTWQRFTQANVSAASPLGTGMSHSSGVFTFPSTGKYLVMLNAHYLLVQNDNVVVQIRVTINNNDYYTYATAKDGNSASNSIAAGSSAIAFVDVTNTSNVKVQIFATSIASGSNVNGYNSSDGVQTSVTFVRLGDT